MTGYSLRLLLGGPVVHKRLVEGVWVRYKPSYAHITDAQKAEFRDLAKRDHERIRREQLLNMPTNGKIN